MPSAITLQALHEVLQAAFGWENYHLWVFETPHGRYGIADQKLQIRDAAAKRLDQVAPAAFDAAQVNTALSKTATVLDED